MRRILGRRSFKFTFRQRFIVLNCSYIFYDELLQRRWCIFLNLKRLFRWTVQSLLLWRKQRSIHYAIICDSCFKFKRVSWKKLLRSDQDQWEKTIEKLTEKTTHYFKRRFFSNRVKNCISPDNVLKTINSPVGVEGGVRLVGKLLNLRLFEPHFNKMLKWLWNNSSQNSFNCEAKPLESNNENAEAYWAVITQLTANVAKKPIKRHSRGHIHITQNDNSVAQGATILSRPWGAHTFFKRAL